MLISRRSSMDDNEDVEMMFVVASSIDCNEAGVEEMERLGRV